MGIHSVRRSALRLTIPLAGFLLAGCLEQNLARRDFITPGGGNTQASNIAVQTIDPWPAGSWNRSIQHDGTRMGNTIDAYREPPPPPVQPLSGNGIKSGLTTN